MNIQRLFNSKFVRSALHWIGLSLLFGIAYTQQLLYTDNQNTKFLQGLARAGLGDLQQDWLANTIDPLPVFSLLVQATYTVFTDYAFCVYPLIAFGIYLYSLLGIADQCFNIGKSRPIYWLCFAFITLIHITRIRLFDIIVHLPLDEGLAQQYILGHYFQPSMLGVFIPLSIYSFLCHRRVQAGVYLAIATSFHPAYLPSVALLTLSYLFTLWIERKPLSELIVTGLVPFLGSLPVFLYMTLTFAPTTPELWQQAEDILVTFRIPHHSLPEVWLHDPGAWVQIGLMMYGIYLVRQMRVVWVLLVPFAVAASLVLAQMILHNDTIALTAPWRVSAFLMPLSMTVIIAHWLQEAERFAQKQFGQDSLRLNQQWVMGGAIAFIAIMVSVGIHRQITILQAPNPARAMLTFVQDTHQPSDTYLVPLSGDRRFDILWPFRLTTGAPIFVNFKSHPYKDIEVLEWYNRVQLAFAFYNSPPEEKCNHLVPILENYPITHVVTVNTRRDLTCEVVSKIHEDDHYEVYQIMQPTPSQQP